MTQIMELWNNARFSLATKRFDSSAANTIKKDKPMPVSNEKIYSCLKRIEAEVLYTKTIVEQIVDESADNAMLRDQLEKTKKALREMEYEDWFKQHGKGGENAN